jgi:transcriptional regulator with XRE-family HTH domain
MGAYTKEDGGEKQMTIGERLRRLRGDKSMVEVAEAIGVTYSSYIKYERNERKPRAEVMHRIAKYYGKTIDSIFFG